MPPSLSSVLDGQLGADSRQGGKTARLAGRTGLATGETCNGAGAGGGGEKYGRQSEKQRGRCILCEGIVLPLNGE